jgi:hypothetical protein
MTPGAGQRHRSYLLRIWRAGNRDAPEWRFLLEDVLTRERQAFVDLDSLMVFLTVQLLSSTCDASQQPAADIHPDRNLS